MTLRNASRRWLVPFCFALLFGGLIVTSPVSVAAVNTLHVTACGDAGANTLRGQIAASGAGDTIVFDQNCTITLTTGTLVLSHTVTINGTGHTVIVDGGCTLTNGVCTSGGVTVFAVLGAVTANLTALTIQHGNGSDGGGIYNLSGTVTVANSTLSGNSASGTSGGGGIYNLDGLIVQSSTLSGNSAGSGGGIYSNGQFAVVRNSTFSGNSSVGGGGIANFGLGLLVQSSTLSGNSASSSGGGIYNCPCADNKMSLNNAIVAGNTAGTLPDVDGTGAVHFHDLIGGTPLLGAFGNYGGPTQTFPLLPGSPAIDAGDDPTCAQAGNTDQRGIARPQGAHCDIGAFESQGFALAKTSGDNQSAIVNGLFATPLAVAVTSSHGEPVNGGQVTFTAPGSGPSATFSSATATITGGAARVTATANGTVGGPYVVTVSAGGPSVVATYSLTNLAAPPNTTYTVGTTADHAGVQTIATTCMAAANTTCALRDALTYATSGTDTVVFNGTGHGTITLTNGPLTLAASVAITGPSANLLAIDGGCTFSSGLCADDPHGVTVFVINSGVTAYISGLTIQHGNASVPDPADGNRLDGGGITNFGGSVTVTNSVLRNNSAQDDGGAIYTNGGQVVVQSSTLSGNFASAAGAIANKFSTGVVTVTNSTITGNTAYYSGGIGNNGGGTLTVTNSTFSGNTAYGDTGGIGNGGGGTMTVTNTIVAGNAGGDVTGAYTGSHNLIGGTPLLGTLGSYGGPTQTIPLLPGSPAIDAGDDTVCSATGTGTVNGVDQRGIARPQGAHCDIGAFEYAVTNPLPGAKPTVPAASAPSPLPGSRPAGTTGGPAPNPLPASRP